MISAPVRRVLVDKADQPFTVAGDRLTVHLAAREGDCRTGAEIVGYLKTGSAYYAPASAAVQMVEAIVKDKKRILPCAAWLTGEYGQDGIFLGVPCKLGASGLEQIFEVDLTDAERAELQSSADAVRETMQALN